MSRSDTPALADLVPLSDRITSTTALRLLVVLAPVALAAALPDLLTVSLEALAATAAAYLAFTLLVARLRSGSRERAISLLLLPLLADGAYLGWVLHATGDLGGPAPYLVGLHVLGVTLLASFRSGLKLAFWHSLVGLVVLEAHSAGLLGVVPTPFPSVGYTWYLVLLWTAALTTASFAAVNERELRRRRFDADALQRFAVAAEQQDDPQQLLALLAELAVDELLAERAVAVLLPPAGTTRGAAVLRRKGAEGALSAPAPLPSTAFGDRSLIRHTLDVRGPVLASCLRREADAWLSGLLPGAARLLAVPLGVHEGMQAALVLECRRPWLHRGPAKVERRLVATAVQAAAHAGQALARALLIEQLRDAAYVDGLTGIANRRRFDLALEAAAVEHPYAVVLLDLDLFKSLNDTHGHQVGDTVLRDVAQALQSRLPAGALLARYGGEEFAVVLPGAGREAALARAEELRQVVASTATAAPVTASIGVALGPDHGPAPSDVLRRADEALYTAKACGRDNVQLSAAPPALPEQRAHAVPATR